MMFLFYSDNTRASALHVISEFKNHLDRNTDVDISNALEAAFLLLSHSQDEEEINAGLSVICHVAEEKNLSSMNKSMLADCIDASRNYVYSDMLDSKKLISEYQSNLHNFSRALYTTSHGTTLTKQQKKIIETFKKTRRLVLSAPTSFGKSMIMQEIIMEMKYNSVAIVVPTIALISETVQKLRNNPRLSDYHIINSTLHTKDNKKKIFILTPEKLDVLLEQEPELAFDFFTIDEIYKIQDDVDRRAVFSSVLYTLSRSNADFYLIGPYFKKFSQNFLEKTKSHFIRYTTEIVQKETINLFNLKHDEKIKLGTSEFVNSKTFETNTKRIYKCLPEQKIFYYKSTPGVESIAKSLSTLVKTENSNNNELINYICETISEKWSLIDYLKKGIAFHHGAMPRHIQSEIVELFNKNQINTLVCTTTLTEGVNTTAKNVIILSDEKGKEKLSGFDYKNIKGRAGRFLHHFTGRVINLVEVPENEKEEISFYYFDSNELGTNEIIRINKEDLSIEQLNERNHIESELRKIQIPIDLVRDNKYIAIEKQIALLTELRNTPHYFDEIFFAGAYPEKHKLSLILELCHRFLFTQKEQQDQSFPFIHLDRLVKFYIYFNPSIKEFIATQPGKKEDTRIRNAFKIISRYFEFALPKYLKCFCDIYNFAAKENSKKEISMNWVITLLQYGFDTPQAIALKDSGVPVDIVKKLESKLRDCTSLEEIKIKIKLQPKLLEELSSYEIKLLKKQI